MKPSSTIITMVILASLIFIIGCKAKKDIYDPTVLAVNVLAEIQKGVPANRIQSELTEFQFEQIKPTNKTLNQYMYTVILKGQSANQLLKAFNMKEYIKSAVLAPMGGGPAENMPPGKSTRTKPIKG